MSKKHWWMESYWVERSFLWLLLVFSVITLMFSLSLIGVDYCQSLQSAKVIGNIEHNINLTLGSAGAENFEI